MPALPFKLNAKTIGIGAGTLVGLALLYKIAFHKSKKAAEDQTPSGDAAALAQIQAQLNQQGQTLAAATAAPAAPAYGQVGYGQPYPPAYGTPGYVAPYPGVAAPGTTQASGPPTTPPVGGYQWIWNGYSWVQSPAATPVGMHWQQLGSTFQLAPNSSSVAYIDRRPANPAAIIPTATLTPPN